MRGWGERKTVGRRAGAKDEGWIQATQAYCPPLYLTTLPTLAWLLTLIAALLNKGMDEEDVAKLLVEEAIDEIPVSYHVKEVKRGEREVEDEEDLDDELDDLMGGFDDGFNMDEYKEKRKKEIQTERSMDAAAKEARKLRYRFGDFEEINREDWEREVNEGSKNGQWVVVVLTSEAVIEAKAVETHMRAVAEMFKSVKFLKVRRSEERSEERSDEYKQASKVIKLAKLISTTSPYSSQIRSTSAIERWPDANLPTVFCYREGEMQKQLIGTKQCGGPGTNAGRLEWRLKALGVLEGSVMVKDAPRTEGAVAETNNLKMGALERKGMHIMETYGTEDDAAAYN